jgi:predicted nuclease with TOPRIM domain
MWWMFATVVFACLSLVVSICLIDSRGSLFELEVKYRNVLSDNVNLMKGNDSLTAKLKKEREEYDALLANHVKLTKALDSSCQQLSKIIAKVEILNDTLAQQPTSYNITRLPDNCVGVYATHRDQICFCVKIFNDGDAEYNYGLAEALLEKLEEKA